MKTGKIHLFSLYACKLQNLQKAIGMHPIKTLKSFAGIFLLILSSSVAFAQLDAGNDTTVCLPGNVTLQATLFNQTSGSAVTFSGLSTVSLSDDQYSGVVPLGFSFTYFGNTYTSCVISSNNYISFNLANANGFSPWSFTNPIPNPGLPTNAIMCPYQDINPGNGGIIEYGTVGTAPNRKFVVRYLQIPMFSCTTLEFCSGVILHEGTDKIETFFEDKPLCTNWNGGLATHGLHNSTGTVGIAVPGRNASQWTAVQDAWEFIPNGPNNYTFNQIPYAPILSNNSVAWSDQNGNVLGTGYSITVNVTQTSTYTASVTGCANTGIGIAPDDVTVHVGCFGCVAPEMDSTNVDCAGDCDGVAMTFPNLDSSSAPFTYVWTDNLGNVLQTTANTMATSDTLTGLCAGIYTVAVTDSVFCTVTEDVMILEPTPLSTTATSVDVTCNSQCDGIADLSVSGGTPPYNYLWTNGFPFADPNNLCAGNHVVTVTDNNNCTITESVTITEPTAVEVTVSGGTTICIGEFTPLTAQASGGTGNYSYVWTNAPPLNDPGVIVDPIETTTVYVSVIDDSGCQSPSDNTTVIVRPPLKVQIIPPDTICRGEFSELRAEAQGGDGNYTFNWNQGVGLTNPGSVSPDYTEVYTVTVTDGCTTPQISDSAEVVVGQIPYTTYKTNLTDGCAPATINFILDSVKSGRSYTWDFGDGTDLNTPNKFVPHVYPYTGCYNIGLTVVSELGCVSEQTEYCLINVYDSPEAHFDIEPQKITMLDPIATFRDFSFDANHWVWNLGDGTIVEDNLFFQHTYSQPGEYNVSLYVDNHGGCFDTLSAKVMVENETTIFIPNSFTPNSDGKNDIFQPLGSGYQNYFYDFVIMNRWGNVLFRSRNPSEGWDGTVRESGKPAPIGVYPFVLTYTANADAQPKIIRGEVTLVR